MAEGQITVLIVDDHPDIRLLVRKTLEAAELGLQVVAEAADGVEALAVFDRLDPPPVPSIIVLDNFMPNMSGIEVATEIRRTLPAQRIVLFSAQLSPELEASARAAGIDACLSKNEVNRLPELIVEMLRTQHDD